MPRTASQLPGRWLLLPAFFFSVLVNLLMLTGPLFMLQVYDRVLSSRSRETLVALVILVLALYALMWLLDFSRGRVLARFGAVVQNRFDAPALRSRLFGGAAHRCDPQDLEHFQAFSASPALTAILDTPFAPAFIVIIFILHPMLGWLALIGGGVLVALTILNEVLTAGRRQRIQKMAEESRSFAEQVAREAEVVRAQGMTDATVAQWADARHRTLTAALSAEDVTSLLSSLTKSARLALQSLILALGAWLALDGQITAGAMIAASILLGRALAPIEQMLARWPQIDRARRAWASIRVLAGDPTEAPQATRLPRPEARLDLRGVTLTGGPGTPARLYNLSASLPPGTALGVLGKSGSGKTTLARVLVGLERPTVGEVRLSGALLDQYGSDLGSHIGYLPQNAGLLPGSLARNIARMSETPDTDKMIAAARKAGVHDMILALPQGYDTMVDAAAQPLSGGQKQRVALARALYGDPAILILDEPNSALDAEGTAALNQAIRIAKDEGRSVVVMTHRPAAISECDSLLVLEAGKMTAYGPRDAVLKSLMRADGTTMAPGPRAIA